MGAHQYDVVVVGAGSTGENVADRVVKGGLSAVVVEAERAGGDCSYWACVPSKALLRPLQALAAARSVAGARQAITGTPDVAAVLSRRDAFVAHWDDKGQVEWLRENRIDLMRGYGRLTGTRRVMVINESGETDLTARHAVVLCTGSRAAVPPIPGLAEAHPWTSREATSAREAPRRLAILGGGVVGCEMATAWSQLGTEQVTIIQHGPRLIPSYEPFASDALSDAFGKRGVRILTRTTATRVSRDTDGTVQLVLDNGETIVADQVLVAAGRQPRTDDLGLETVGLRPGAWLEVDDSMRVVAAKGAGCTLPVTSTVAPCSRTWANTRRVSAGTSSRPALTTDLNLQPLHRGRATPPPPTTTPCLRSSSPNQRSLRSGSPPRRRRLAASRFVSLTTTLVALLAPPCTLTVTRVGHGWWLTRRAAWSSG